VSTVPAACDCCATHQLSMSVQVVSSLSQCAPARSVAVCPGWPLCLQPRLGSPHPLAGFVTCDFGLQPDVVVQAGCCLKRMHAAPRWRGCCVRCCGCSCRAVCVLSVAASCLVLVLCSGHSGRCSVESLIVHIPAHPPFPISWTFHLCGHAKPGASACGCSELHGTPTPCTRD
jgi:hypothetical protein